MARESRSNSGHNSVELAPDDVESYLKSNPGFLDNYVLKHVGCDTLQKWVSDCQQYSSITGSTTGIDRVQYSSTSGIDRVQYTSTTSVVSSSSTRRQSLSQWKFGCSAITTNSTGNRDTSGGSGGGSSTGGTGGALNPFILKNLALTLQKNPYVPNLLWELSLCISSAISANFFVLYLFDQDSKRLRRFSQLKTGQDLTQYEFQDELSLATYVAKGREPVIMSRREVVARFASGLGDHGSLDHSDYILCHPIIRLDGEICGVIELHREGMGQSFYIEDQEIVNSYLVWGSVALNYADLNSVMKKQKGQNDFLLDVVRSIFQDMISMDVLIKKIMKFAQRLVDADRASLFLVDNKTRELYARLFDTGQAESIDSPTQEIRIPVGVGVAGQVAATGEILNISDAYKDRRFNREVDKVTGYLTKTILCMPIFSRGQVIGVVQMLNKRSGVFTEDDEKAFATYATYCGLALHHAKLYDKIRRSEQKYNVALEVLSYYNTCSEAEFEEARRVGIISREETIGIDDFYFNPLATDDMKKVHHAVYMFTDLFGTCRFDLNSIYRFILTVKKNYRRVPYHNWTHGFSVANCMYVILKKTDAFRRLERLALYIGCLCHDVDHRGKNNKFMLDSASPIAAMYSTSTMEHHHFNQTVTILQRDGHNIFGKLNSEDYKAILGNIKHCILATDLANFFGNKSKLQSIVDSGTFTWAVTEPRLLVQAVAMTAADLCASSKPWEVQLETVKVIFEEFYEQGDLEKKVGRKPIPMMDRERADEQPGSQVGFLQGICIPCYDILCRIIPETLPLLKGCKLNLAEWQRRVDHQSEKGSE